MAVEYTQEPFYNGLGSHFIDTHISQKIAIEYFLSQVIFKNDLSRIIYSQETMAFRKRVELLNSVAKEEDITVTSLKLPFGCYYRTKGYEPTERTANKQHSTAVTGFYDEETDSWLRWQSVVSEYDITLFFARQDDLRTAAHLLFWEKNPEAPITLVTTIQYRNREYYLPVFIRIKDIDEATSYKEEESLKQNRIFPLKMKVEVQSALLLMDSSKILLDIKQNLPLKFQDSPQYDETNVSYAVERVTLTWACEKFNLSNEAPESQIPYKESVIQKVKSIKACIPSNNGEELYVVPNIETMDIMKGYFSESTEVSLNYFRQNIDKSTTTSVFLEFQVKNSDRQFFNKITFLIAGRDKIEITDCKDKDLEIMGLTPDSSYNLSAIVESINGETSTLQLTVTTLADPENKSPTIGKRFKKGNALVGMKF